MDSISAIKISDYSYENVQGTDYFQKKYRSTTNTVLSFECLGKISVILVHIFQKFFESEILKHISINSNMLKANSWRRRKEHVFLNLLLQTEKLMKDLLPIF